VIRIKSLIMNLGLAPKRKVAPFLWNEKANFERALFPKAFFVPTPNRFHQIVAIRSKAKTSDTAIQIALLKHVRKDHKLFYAWGVAAAIKVKRHFQSPANLGGKYHRYQGIH